MTTMEQLWNPGNLLKWNVRSIRKVKIKIKKR
jgi:hypothetical protein